jgi:hypothetical protein
MSSVRGGPRSARAEPRAKLRQAKIASHPRRGPRGKALLGPPTLQRSLRPSPSAPEPLVERGSSCLEGIRQSIDGRWRPGRRGSMPRVDASEGGSTRVESLHRGANSRGSFHGVRYEKESCHSVDCRRGAPSRRRPPVPCRDLGGQRRGRSDGDLGGKRDRHCGIPDPAPVRRAEDQELPHHVRPHLPPGSPLQGLLHPVRSRLPQPQLPVIRREPP